MELFKYNDVIGAVVGKKTTNGITMLKIDYAGTIMYLPESDNELKNNEIPNMETGGRLNKFGNPLEDYETEYNGEIINNFNHTPEEWYTNDQTFYSLEEAQAYIDNGSPMDERTINAYRHGAFEAGGKTDPCWDDYEMLGMKDKNGRQVPNCIPKLETGGQVGSNDLSPKLSPVCIGKSITLKMPNNEQRKGAFLIVELSQITASHNEKTFASSEGYPTDDNGDNINDRNYTNDKSAQARVQEWGINLDADRLITTSRTPSGTPIINVDGYVVSGNNRTMSLKLAASEIYNPRSYSEYVAFLIEEAEAFGFTPELNRTENKVGFKKSGGTENVFFDKPALVRVDYDIPALNTLELSKYNKDTKKSEKPIDKAIKLGKILNSNEVCKRVISDIVGSYETFSDFYSNSSDQKLMASTLVECNILTTQEIPSFYSDQGFTTEGKELIENLLAGLVLSKPALIIADNRVKNFRRIIITSLPILTANSALGQDSLTKPLSEAILIEGKIRAAGLEFVTWINQTSMFDDKPSYESLVLNRLLASGRNNFKRTISKYNESIENNKNESLFGDNMDSDMIFQKIVEAAITENERLTIENFTLGVTSVITNDIKKETMANPFLNGKYFENNPDHVLAKTELSSSAYGKEVTIYKGSISDVARIDAEINFIESFEKSNPVISVINKPIEEITDVDVTQIENLKAASKQSKKDQHKKIKKAAKKTPNAPAASFSDNLETLSLKEVYYMEDENGLKLNSEISADELKVYLWYKIQQSRPISNPEWYELAETSYDDLMRTNVDEWVKKGLLYYYKDELLPAYVYLSGDVYSKHEMLVVSELSLRVGMDAKTILEKYGEEVLNNQIKALNKVFETKYNNRLRIEGPNSESGLTILPISKFAKNHMINTLVDETPFKMKRIEASSNKSYGKPDFFKLNVSTWKQHEFAELSLTDAFCYWLVKEKTINYKQGTNYVTIIQNYIQGKAKPKTTAFKDFDGKYTGEQKKIFDKEVAAFEREKSRTKTEGDRLFKVFLNEFITLNDKVKIETIWNKSFNNIVPLDFNKVPVAFKMNKYIDGQPLDIRPEKREAVAFTSNNGSGLLAYDVGVGKTPAAIFTISQFIDMGYSKRPLIIVPNQTYKQWISEIKNFCGHIPINELYNLSDSIVEEFLDVNGDSNKVPEKSITIVTYEGMKRLGFGEDVANELQGKIYPILMQSTEGLSDKKADQRMVQVNASVEKLLGTALRRTTINVEDLGFDYACLDEAHAAKKVFTHVQGEATEHLGDSSKKTQAKSNYSISAGTPSENAIKAFCICQYIQTTYNGNTQLLTATPFTNSPLEVYSMLSMISHKELVKQNLENLNTFFDTFIEISYEMVINAKMQPQRKQIILGYNNLIVLQDLIRRFINYKTGEQVNVKRPNKIVLPLRSELVDGVLMKLPEDKMVDCILPMSPLQNDLMDKIKDYAAGKIDEAYLCSGETSQADDSDDAESSEEIDISEDAMDASEKAGVRVLKSLSFARNLALSPYLFDCAGLGNPTYKEYVETSNKILYTMKSIASIKQHHLNTKTPMSGIVIYMDRGVNFFNLIKEYLIKEIGFNENEIGIISSKVYAPVPKGLKANQKKEFVKNLFLGKKFNNATLELERIPDEQRVKVLIGSSTIKEGINLQEYSSTLFNLFLPWNPTDIQQLEGRIYRQKNAFANVRIVNPLMIDSMDIFMFQKLEEKTSRINTIWESDGRTNVLKTDDFNPKELKYTLIKDARIIANMEILEDEEKLEEKQADLKNQIELNLQLLTYETELNNYANDAYKYLLEYRPKQRKPYSSIESLESRLKTTQSNIKMIQNVLKTQKDKDGKLMAYPSYDRDEKIEYSRATPASKPHFLDKLNIAVRNLARFNETYLVPKNISLEDLRNVNAKIELEIEDLSNNRTEISSEENLKIKVDIINAKREASGYKEKTLDETITAFETLNYLLNDVKIKAPAITKSQCPPLGPDGKPAIDADSLRLLDECLKHEPDTKLMHTTETINEQTGESKRTYTPARLKLHDKIIKKLTKNAICITNDQPIAVLMGGSPGSGKSTFLKKNAEYMTSDKIWAIDADEVRSNLPEYKGYNAGSTHPETQDIVRKMLGNYDKPCKHDLLFDGTMNNIAKYKGVIRQLRKLKYKIFIAYMEIPKEISIERALNRYKNNSGGETEFGRYVPISVIDNFFDTGDDGFQALKTDVDGFIKIDSLSGKVMEKGGEPIPETRSYAKVFDEAETTQAMNFKTESNDLSNELKASLQGAKIALKYANSKEKIEISKFVKGLKITIKYLK